MASRPGKHIPIEEISTRVGGLIEQDACWEGVVTLAADVLVPEAVTLRIRAGTRVVFPEGCGGVALSRWGRAGRVLLGTAGAGHLKILGAVEIFGADEAPVIFEGAAFGGILLAGHGRLKARGARFSTSAGFAVQCADLSIASLTDCLFSGGRGAVFCCGFSRARLRRGRYTGSDQSCLWVCDDAVLRAVDCVLEANVWALAAEGLSRVVLRGCRFIGNRRGVDMTGGARLRSAGSEWRGHETAFSAQMESAAELSGDFFSGNASAVEVLGDAACAARRCRFERNQTACWLHQRARFDGENLELRDNDVGLRASHSARLSVSHSFITGRPGTGVQRVDRARARLDDVEFDQSPSPGVR